MTDMLRTWKTVDNEEEKAYKNGTSGKRIDIGKQKQKRSTLVEKILWPRGGFGSKEYLHFVKRKSRPMP